MRRTYWSNIRMTAPRWAAGVLLSLSASTLPADSGKLRSPPAKTPPIERPPGREEETLSPDERQLWEATNAERIRARVPGLKIDPVLLQMAREQARLMAEAGQVSHAVIGRTFEIRLRGAKYAAQSAAENCSAGQRTPAGAVAGWLLSPGHKANLLNPGFQHVGVGTATGRSGIRYYAQVFGRPSGAPAKTPPPGSSAPSPSGPKEPMVPGG